MPQKSKHTAPEQPAPSSHTQGAQSQENAPNSGFTRGKIRPVIIFPFGWRRDNKDLILLYESFIAKLCADTDKYARPITVIDDKTYYNNAIFKFDDAWNREFESFLEDVVQKHSQIIRAWCVDTCQMWNTGLGEAFKQGGVNDVYWQIPGDFFYSQRPDVLDLLTEIPEAVHRHGQDFCIGEISVDVNSAKQLIDTYGTYGLLYNWFPKEAQKIRKKTDKPRSEFFAIYGTFLQELLMQRWYPYEQTIVILIQAILSNKHIARVKLGDISDLPQGRESLAAAMQQVERTERVLKTVWREHNEQESGWIERFRILDQQSGQVRGAALIILQNLLPG